MFKENSEGQSGDVSDLKSVALPTSSPAKLTEDEIVEFTGNWNLMVAYTLLDVQGFVMNPENLRKRMNISLQEADSIIDTLDSMGLVKKNDESYDGQTLFFDDSMAQRMDILNNTLKVKSKPCLFRGLT